MRSLRPGVLKAVEEQLRPQLHENHVKPIGLQDSPPYSPHMNPIEKLWAAIKQQWRQRRLRGFPPLQATLQADLQQIVEKSGKAIVATF